MKKIITLLIMLISLSCRNETVKQEAEQIERISVAISRNEIINPEFDTFGTIIYFNKADIFPTTEGHIEYLLTEEGREVTRGQVLAKLMQQKLIIKKEESEAEIKSKKALLELSEEKLKEGQKGIEAKLIAIKNTEAELEQRRAEFENISNVYDNKKKLFKVEGVSKEELEAIKTQYLSYKTKFAQTEGELEIQKLGFRDRDIIEAGFRVPENYEKRKQILIEINTRMLEAERKVAEAELNAVSANLRTIELLISETIIRAPISGVIGSRYLDIGEKVTTESRLFTIFNIERVYIQIEVSEKDLSLIRPGQKALIYTEADKSNWREGSVKLISPFINPETRTARIKLEMDNTDRLFSPGMFVRVKIITGLPEKRILIPKDSVLTGPGGNYYLFLVRKNRLFKQEVEVGSEHQDSIVILDGIEEGDRVCSNPSVSFRDGMEVEVIK